MRLPPAWPLWLLLNKDLLCQAEESCLARVHSSQPAFATEWWLKAGSVGLVSLGAEPFLCQCLSGPPLFGG